MQMLLRLQLISHCRIMGSMVMHPRAQRLPARELRTSRCAKTPLAQCSHDALRADRVVGTLCSVFNIACQATSATCPVVRHLKIMTQLDVHLTSLAEIRMTDVATLPLCSPCTDTYCLCRQAGVSAVAACSSLATVSTIARLRKRTQISPGASASMLPWLAQTARKQQAMPLWTRCHPSAA